MLNTNKIIYLLPDVAYIAELLPTKKEHTFAVQTFRQINGEFITQDDDLIIENCAKLINKIDADEYQLVLPDFLFTNTIVSLQETSENKVKEYLKEKLLPELDLDKETHDVKTFIVTQHGGKSKVQISALEKTVLEPLRAPALKKDIKISGVYPLSWTIKSVISLEPSISVIQIGTQLHLALHYIGVDQCVTHTTAEVSAIAETIKTLKGAESSIQTVYLLTNELVEKELTDILSGTLPLQQLTDYSQEQPDLPAYVKHIIESGLKTLSIPDFPVPIFPLGKVLGTLPEKTKTVETNEAVGAPRPTVQAFDIFDDEDSEKNEEKDKLAEETRASDLGENDDEDAVSFSALPEPTRPTVAELESEDFDKNNDDDDRRAAEIKSNLDSSLKLPIKIDSAPSQLVIEEVANVVTVEEFAVEPKELAFMKTYAPETVASTTHANTPTMTLNSSIPEKKKIIIKKQNSAQPLIKMIVVTLIVFFVTVGVGVGIGFGLLSLNTPNTVISPAPSASPTPIATPLPTAIPTPLPELARGEYSVLVVNATTISGRAGVFQKKLIDAEYKSVAAGNAKGEYSGTKNYVLLNETNDQLLKTLEEDAGLTLTIDEKFKKTTEDPKNTYDAVIVLADDSE